ncbi:lysophospholipid acyltransferase family protein [Nitrincola alkalilacustris]|uniref:lysophospholipid acyltransferase family protein n=1 Tax=Nitrincola alkalilacustris TaxID=1571224 RepID=UPI00124DDB4F|nr:lysophospholipid acyltransferase family protein [Nitrincola alkalilacustris]
MKKFKALLVIMLLGLLSLLPLDTARNLGRKLGRYLYRSGDKHKVCRTTRQNIEACFPEMPEAARERLVEASLVETGAVGAEMGMALMWSARRTLSRVQYIENEGLLKKGLERGKGIIVLGPHLGNWEVLGLYLSAHYPLTAMYKPPRLELLERMVRRKRERLGANLVPANLKGVRALLKALKRGEVVGILPDQEPEPEGGVFAPFFGKQALTMKLLPQLAAQSGAMVVCGFALRLSNGDGFSIHFSEVGGNIHSRDVELAATEMNQAIESCVALAPEQYQWEYKRFYTRPEGEPPIY